jgi:hypothetical protein
VNRLVDPIVFGLQPGEANPKELGGPGQDLGPIGAREKDTTVLDLGDRDTEPRRQDAGNLVEENT